MIDRIRKGAGSDALKAVGYDGTPEQHPVVKEVLGRIGAAGTPATEVEKAVQSEPFGWPREALMASIGVLIDTGLIRQRSTAPSASTSQVLSQTRLGTVHLRHESTVLKTSEKIAARSLLNKLGVPADNDTLVAAAAQAVTQLSQRAAAASGPAPLPEIACPTSIEVVLTTSGNDSVHALLAAKGEITEFSDRLETLERRRAPRLETLATARSLADAAAGLGSAVESRARLSAFESTRELLADTDQISPILGDLAAAVRGAVRDAAASLEATRQQAVDGLRQQSAWSALDSAKQEQLLADYSLAPEGMPELGDPSAVLVAVQRRPLAAWEAVLDAVPTRASKTLEAAVRLTAPRSATVTIPTTSLRSVEVEPYLDELREKLTGALAEHDIVVVKGQ